MDKLKLNKKRGRYWKIATILTFFIVRLVCRVDRVEGVMVSVLTRVERILARLDTLQRTKSLRQANMARILDGFTEYPGGKLLRYSFFT